MRAFFRLIGPFRFVCLTLLVGFALIGYVLLIQNYSGKQIKSLRVYERGFGFYQIETKLLAAHAPIRVLVDMTTIREDLSSERTDLTVTAATNGRTVLAQTVDFFRSQPKKPPVDEEVFRRDAGMISDVSDGVYVFTVGFGDFDEIEMQSVDLVLRAGAMGYDSRIMPIGVVLALIGGLGTIIVLSRYRISDLPFPNPKPSRPRSGRGSGRRRVRKA